MAMLNNQMVYWIILYQYFWIITILKGVSWVSPSQPTSIKERRRVLNTARMLIIVVSPENPSFLIGCPKLFFLWSLRIGMCSPVNLLLRCFLVLIQMHSITIQILVGNVSKLYIYIYIYFHKTHWHICIIVIIKCTVYSLPSYHNL